MTLPEYLKAEKLSVAEFARQAGVKNKQTMHKYVHGMRFPPPETLRRIRRLTGGKVTADDFVAQHLAQPGRSEEPECMQVAV